MENGVKKAQDPHTHYKTAIKHTEVNCAVRSQKAKAWVLCKGTPAHDFPQLSQGPDLPSWPHHLSCTACCSSCLMAYWCRHITLYFPFLNIAPFSTQNYHYSGVMKEACSHSTSAGSRRRTPSLPPCTLPFILPSIWKFA